MGGDAAGDDALLHVVYVGQGQMLRRSDVAQEGRAIHGRDGPADGSGDVVIARGDIRHQRT